MEWTKPRSKDVLPKLLRRLKKDSIPSKMLILEKKRKEMPQKENVKKKCTYFSSYQKIIKNNMEETVQNVEVDNIEGEEVQYMEERNDTTEVEMYVDIFF